MGVGRRTAPAVLVASAVMVVGCATAPPPRPAAPVLPAIADPREVRGADPCAVLTADRLGALGLPAPGMPIRSGPGTGCSWQGAGGLALTVTLYTQGGGLETLAGNSEPTTARVRLAGYPALETFTAGGRFCQYDVASAPGQVVMVALANGTPDSCTAAQPIAAAVLDGLPPLAS